MNDRVVSELKIRGKESGSQVPNGQGGYHE